MTLQKRPSGGQRDEVVGRRDKSDAAGTQEQTPAAPQRQGHVSEVA